MNKEFLRWLVIGIIIGVGILFFISNVFAKQDHKEYICHFDGRSGNFQTLYVDKHSADNHIRRHEQDYRGQCEEEVTPNRGHYTDTSTRTNYNTRSYSNTNTYLS